MYRTQGVVSSSATAIFPFCSTKTYVHVCVHDECFKILLSCSYVEGTIICNGQGKSPILFFHLHVVTSHITCLYKYSLLNNVLIPSFVKPILCQCKLQYGSSCKFAFVLLLLLLLIFFIFCCCFLSFHLVLNFCFFALGNVWMQLFKIWKKNKIARKRGY